MDDSQYKKFRLGNIFIFVPLVILILSIILTLTSPAKSGIINKETLSTNKLYNKNCYCCKNNCTLNKEQYYEYMIPEFYQEDNMKTLNISAPNSAIIKATVEQGNEIIHVEEI